MSILTLAYGFGWKAWIRNRVGIWWYGGRRESACFCYGCLHWWDAVRDNLYGIFWLLVYIIVDIQHYKASTIMLHAG